MSDPLLKVDRVSKHFGGFAALTDVSIAVAPGERFGLIGPNGSGKTTTLKAALGLADFEGELRVLGRDPRTERDELMQDVCFIADVAVLPRWINVKQAIDFTAGVHPRFDRAKAERYLSHTKLQPNTILPRSMNMRSVSTSWISST